MEVVLSSADRRWLASANFQLALDLPPTIICRRYFWNDSVAIDEITPSAVNWHPSKIVLCGHLSSNWFKVWSSRCVLSSKMNHGDNYSFCRMHCSSVHSRNDPASQDWQYLCRMIDRGNAVTHRIYNALHLTHSPHILTFPMSSSPSSGFVLADDNSARNNEHTSKIRQHPPHFPCPSVNS